MERIGVTSGTVRGQASVWAGGEMAKQMIHAYVDEGMTPIDAIRSGTINAARLLGWQDKVGSIEPNKLADLIAVEGDPATDINSIDRIRFVMKGGDVVLDRTTQLPSH